VTIDLKSESLKLLELSGPVQDCNGIALPLPSGKDVIAQKSGVPNEQARTRLVKRQRDSCTTGTIFNVSLTALNKFTDWFVRNVYPCLEIQVFTLFCCLKEGRRER
jgi:hypothetical protein